MLVARAILLLKQHSKSKSKNANKKQTTAPMILPTDPAEEVAVEGEMIRYTPRPTRPAIAKNIIVQINMPAQHLMSSIKIIAIMIAMGMLKSRRE